MNKNQASKVISLCLELLQTEDRWKKESKFSEKCLMGSSSYTLGCALDLMQISVMGQAKSRSLVMKKVRNRIRRHFLWRHGWHPITNFNRHKNTSYEDVIFLLKEVHKSL